jgi:hypothetical protein
LVALVEDPRIEDSELAAQLGISVANLHQRRKRMRLYCAAALLLDEHEVLGDDELAGRLRVDASEDNVRIFNRVRFHLCNPVHGRMA